MTTKYMSLNVLKISVISRGRSTSEIADIFNTFDEIFFFFFFFGGGGGGGGGYLPKKGSIFFSFFSLRVKLNFFSESFS